MHALKFMHVCAIVLVLLGLTIFTFVGFVLTLNDLSSVYGKLIKAAGKWFNLGLVLGMSFDILDNIRDKHGDNQNCLREMLAVRLKTANFTYTEVCQSLRAPTVDRNDVAEAIEKECTGMNSHEANLDHSTSISMDRHQYTVNCYILVRNVTCSIQLQMTIFRLGHLRSENCPHRILNQPVSRITL